MLSKTHNIYFKAILALLSLASCSTGQDIPTIFNELLQVSCEVSGFVSRTPRAVPERPSSKDPKEFFNYLYPLADLTMEDLLHNNEQQRSSSPLAISTWIDDFIDIWQTQCHSRARQRRRQERSYRREDNEEFSIHELENPEAIEQLPGSANPSADQSVTEASPVATAASNDTAPKAPAAPVTDTDRFFAQYGGDIEYFFPLIQFGIPFDGEITVLGFKGFKGLWPY